MHFLSSLRKQGSSYFNNLWIPAFAGMTFFNTPPEAADQKFNMEFIPGIGPSTFTSVLT